MIKLNKLNKFYYKGKSNEIHVINDINLELPQKGIVAIFGKSGCGKTTLLNVIGGLDKVNDGQILINEVDISKNTDVIRNKNIGYIFQNYNLNKQENCYDNVADALRLCGMTDENEIEKRVMAALRNVDMEKYRYRNPDTLSGGQMQRIAIARAIVKNPLIILADEPTGNLDEHNTIMIMDLLREISENHLVILVTHEADLVGLYCDKIVELKDGKVVNISDNNISTKHIARDKNDIYLGELNKTTNTSEYLNLEYYGEELNKPLDIKVVNKDGKIYLQVNTPRVQIIDEASEVKLKDGSFEETKEEIKEYKKMEEIPEFTGKKYGKLFNAKSSIKSGYQANFTKKKKGNKLLRFVLIFFAFVLTIVTARFGVAFRDIIKANEAYNNNVFYLFVPNLSTGEKIENSLNEDAGIDYIRYINNSEYGTLKTFNFVSGNFETFQDSYYSSGISCQAVLFGTKLLGDKKVLAGRINNLADNEMVITSAVADELIGESTVGYITKYRDLLGLVSKENYYYDYYMPAGNNSFKIVGVVESNEKAAYVTDYTITEQMLSYSSKLSVTSQNDYNVEVPEGNLIVIVNYEDIYASDKTPVVNEKILIHGKEYNVLKVYRNYNNYEDYVVRNGYGLLNLESYIDDIILDDSTLVKNSIEYYQKYEECLETEYVNWLNYYYVYVDNYIKDISFFSSYNYDMKSWLYTTKGFDIFKYYFMNTNEGEDGSLYFIAEKYKEINGVYPTYSELFEDYTYEYDYYSQIKNIENQYSDEYYSTMNQKYYGYNSIDYVMNSNDYASLSTSMGETDSRLTYSIFYSGTAYDQYEGYFALIHSTDIEKTTKYLNDNFSDIEIQNYYYEDTIKPITTPEDVYSNNLNASKVQIRTNLITLIIIIAILCVCMYFIMRAALMTRIHEIGIYRAIGVSKKNLLFRFLIESIVLATLTIFIGYLFASGVIYFWFSRSLLMKDIFYYPLWLALGTLILLYGVSGLCGIIPVFALVQRTPSAILSKYDI